MGRLVEAALGELASFEEEIAIKSRTINSIDSKKLLSQISRNIHRTLDLSTIWQQTVDSLGAALNVSHSIICSYKPEHLQLQVVAEYRQMPVRSMLGMEIDVVNESGFFRHYRRWNRLYLSKKNILTFSSRCCWLLLPIKTNRMD